MRKLFLPAVLLIFLFISFQLLQGGQKTVSQNQTEPVKSSASEALTPAGDSGSSCDFTEAEIKFMQILKKDPLQKRSSIKCDPIVLRVARERAKDMAERNYFSHTNPDGFGPNYLLNKAGYTLPSYWLTQRTANYIESISAGRATAEDTYRGWMNSPGHRRHILGMIDFYASQTVVAIGHYYAPGTKFGHYWVFFSVPPRSE